MKKKAFLIIEGLWAVADPDNSNQKTDVRPRALQQVKSPASSSKGHRVDPAFSLLRAIHSDVTNFAALKATLLAVMVTMYLSCTCQPFSAPSIHSHWIWAVRVFKTLGNFQTLDFGRGVRLVKVRALLRFA